MIASLLILPQFFNFTKCLSPFLAIAWGKSRGIKIYKRKTASSTWSNINPDYNSIFFFLEFPALNPIPMYPIISCCALPPPMLTGMIVRVGRHGGIPDRRNRTTKVLIPNGRIRDPNCKKARSAPILVSLSFSVFLLFLNGFSQLMIGQIKAVRSLKYV